MTKLTLKHLRYFEALARHGHFGRAAESCAISQPALSVQIKDLEEVVGAPLVERRSRQIVLTALGAEFAERAREILRSVESLEGVGRAPQSPFAGRLRLGIIPTIAPYLLPRIIQDLSMRYPGLEIFPRESVTRKLIDDLAEARLDVAILALPISEPTLREVALFNEEFILVRPLSDAQKPVPSAEMLKEMRLLLLEEGHCFRDQALSFCKFSNAAPRDLMEGSSLSTLVQMVGAGIGVTLIPEMALPLETRSAAVSLARLPHPRPTRSIGMVWRKTNPLSEQFENLAALVRKMDKAQPEKAVTVKQ